MNACDVHCVATGQEKMLLAEAEFLKQLPPHNHLINFLLNMSSKGTHTHTHTHTHTRTHARMHAHMYTKAKFLAATKW